MAFSNPEMLNARLFFVWITPPRPSCAPRRPPRSEKPQHLEMAAFGVPLSGANLQANGSISQVLKYSDAGETRFWGPFCASFWRGSKRESAGEGF